MVTLEQRVHQRLADRDLCDCELDQQEFRAVRRLRTKGLAIRSVERDEFGYSWRYRSRTGQVWVLGGAQ